jgi:hypothetical protein
MAGFPPATFTAQIFNDGLTSILAVRHRDQAKSDGSSEFVPPLFALITYAAPMSETPERLTPATAEDVADALAFALRFQGPKRVHNADELTSEITGGSWTIRSLFVAGRPDQQGQRGRAERASASGALRCAHTQRLRFLGKFKSNL